MAEKNDPSCSKYFFLYTDSLENVYIEIPENSTRTQFRRFFNSNSSLRKWYSRKRELRSIHISFYSVLIIGLGLELFKRFTLRVHITLTTIY